MIFRYFLTLFEGPSPSFYNLTLTVSTGWVDAPAAIEATPAKNILRNGLFYSGPIEFINLIKYYALIIIISS